MVLYQYLAGFVLVEVPRRFFLGSDPVSTLMIAGGALVALSGPRYPDLVIGGLVSVAVLRGGLRIIRDARGEPSPTSS